MKSNVIGDSLVAKILLGTMEKPLLEATKNSYSTATMWASRISSALVSTIGGAIIGGPIGALTGLALNCLDECLISTQKVEKHYLTQGTFWTSATLLPAAIKLAQVCSSEDDTYEKYFQTAAAVMGFTIPFFTEDFLDYKDKLEIPIASFDTLNRFFDRKGVVSQKEWKELIQELKSDPRKGLQRAYSDIKEIANNPFIANLAENLSLGFFKHSVITETDLIIAKYAGHYFAEALLNEAFQKSKTLDFGDLSYNALYILSVFFLRATMNYFIDIRREAKFHEVFQILTERYANIVIHKENAQKILIDDRHEDYLFQLPMDLNTIANEGVYCFNGILYDTRRSLHYLNKLMPLAPDALAPYLISTLVSQKLLKNIVIESQKTQQEHDMFINESWKARFTALGNLDKISLRDGEEFARNKFCEPVKKENELSAKSRVLIQKKNYSREIVNILNKVIDISYLGAKVLYDQFKLENLFKLKLIQSGLCNFFSSNLSYKDKNKNVIVALKRANNFFKVIEKEREIGAEKKITRGQNIVLKNYQLNLGNEKLTQIDHFEFEGGKRYALMGKSGCGKSSLLADLKMGVYGKLNSSGEMLIGTKGGQPHVMFIDQNLFLPGESTLLEVIYFPKIFQELNDIEIEKLKEKVLLLFDELDIDRFSTEGEESESLSNKLLSKEFKLSGGQSKKIAIIQAVLMQPDILIMDETLTGLDESSLIKVERVLQKYVGSTILCVDHHARENNHNDFYHKIITFEEDGLKEEILN